MAETAESSKEGSVDTAVAMTERDFEPPSGQDIDDEATIDEEETLEAGEGFNHDELNDLQKVFRRRRSQFDFDLVIDMMLRCNRSCGRPREGWRRPEGYWGYVLQKCAVGNTKAHRKKLYMAWKRNMNNFRDKLFERLNSLIQNDKDAEVPIEDLLALYYNPGNTRGDDDEDDEEDDTGHVPLDDIQPEPLPPYEDHTEDIQENGVDISPRESPVPQDSPQSRPDSPSQTSSVNPPENQRITRGLAAAYQYYPDSDSSSSDEDYSPAEDWKKEIHIGPEHQAEVPLTTCPDTNDDEEQDSKCLWSPKGITEEKLQKYVDTVCGPGWDGGTACVPSKGDDEQALYVLLQCNYNCDEAIKKFKSQPPPSQEMTFWSEEECRNFELGLRQFGKDFYSIQKSKIPGRTVGDIVQFYYLWKKTERHDAFSWQIRSKKKYSFHPGITDYMDRFLDENESAASSRAGSPGRAHITQSTSANEDGRALTISSATENAVLKRPASSDVHYAGSTMMSGLLRIPQSYVPTSVIVSNDKEPPAKKPNLGNPESLPITNGPPPLKPHDNSILQIPQLASHVTSHVAMTTSHSTSHMTNHVMHIPNQLGIDSTAPTSLTNSSSLQFSSLNSQRHLNMHNIESTGNTYARLTQNS